MKLTPKEIAQILNDAVENTRVENPDMSGTENMDDFIIQLKGKRQLFIDEINAHLKYFRIGEKVKSWFWNGYRFTGVASHLRDNARTMQCELIRNYCKSKGLDTTGVYYQMD